MTIDVRQAFERARARVQELHHSGTPATELVELHTHDVDIIVTNVFEGALARSGHDPAGIALIALGGYGRNELAPNSDLDLLLLYRGWDAPDVSTLNRDVMYPLWDSRRELGDRIREPRDVVRNLSHVDEVCAMLDARLLTGDRGLFADMRASVWRRVERGQASFFADLTKATADRHARYGHAGHLLEPNIRDSAGGLRDIHTLGWASKVLPGGEGIDALVDAGYLSRIDGDLIEAARSFMLNVRVELHLATARHQDQLYLNEQDEIAQRLRYEATDGRPPADRLMQELSFHAREVDAVVSTFWERILHSKRRRRWRSSRSESVNVGDGCVLKEGRLEVVAVTSVADDPAGWLRVFRQTILRDAPLGRHSFNRLHEELAAVELPLRWTAEARDVFLDVLQSGKGGARALDAMVMGGVLPGLVPEWEAIRAFPQRDLYHRYTVDRHLIAAVEELARSRDLEEPDVRDAWSAVGDADALFVATLLHDIGKGRGGDHSVLGEEIATGCAASMALTAAQVHDVGFLVRDHLVLAETATRRDLNDPRTVAEVAERVGDGRRLAMLYLLTRADSLATGPEAWSSFRSSLVRELYSRTREHLAGVPMHEGASAQRLTDLAETLGLSRDEAARLIGPMPESWIAGLDPESAGRQLALLRDPPAGTDVRTAVHSTEEADELILVAADRPGLFATVAGVLALRGFDVHDAEIYTRSDGIAVEVFRVIGRHGAVSDDRWARMRSDIVAALDGSLDLDAELSKKSAQTRKRRAGRRPQAGVRVVVDNDASVASTVVEVHTEDRVGLLRLITSTLTRVGCDLSVAKVATYGAQVVDVFYVRDLEGRKIDDPEQIRRIERELTSVLGPGEQR
jgi:[protein-PII] uridylyltransferase